MALNFTQFGYDLEIDETTSETPPQFTRGGLCSVQLTDDTFDGLDKLVLLFAPDDGRRHTPAVVELSKTDSDGMHYSGAFTRASMLNDGPVLVALAGTTSTQTITSNAYQIRVGKSLDPESGMLADPATLEDIVYRAVDGVNRWTLVRDIELLEDSESIILSFNPAEINDIYIRCYIIGNSSENGTGFTIQASTTNSPGGDFTLYSSNFDSTPSDGLYIRLRGIRIGSKLEDISVNVAKISENADTYAASGHGGHFYWTAPQNIVLKPNVSGVMWAAGSRADMWVR